MFTQCLPSTGPTGIRELVRDVENNAGPLPTQPCSLSTHSPAQELSDTRVLLLQQHCGAGSAQHEGCPNSAAPGLLSSMGLNPTISPPVFGVVPKPSLCCTGEPSTSHSTKPCPCCAGKRVARGMCFEKALEHFLEPEGSGTCLGSSKQCAGALKTTLTNFGFKRNLTDFEEEECWMSATLEIVQEGLGPRSF